MFYRLVIQNNPDGSLSGAAAYDTPTSDARPVTEDDLLKIMPDVNAATLNQRSAIEAEHVIAIKAVTDERDAAKAETVQKVAEATAEGADALAKLQQEKDDAIASLIAERDAAISKCAAVVAKAKDPTATIEDVAAEADKEQRQREIEELDKLIAEEEQRLADDKAKRAELSK